MIEVEDFIFILGRRPLMGRVYRIGKDVKAKKLKRKRIKELIGMEVSEAGVETKVQLIQELITLGMIHVEDVLQDEVRQLAGERYKRNGQEGYDRWGRQWGSVYVGDQKVPIEYPRVRDTRANREVELSSYQKLQEPGGVHEGLLKKVLFGLSCRRYKECSQVIPEVFGMSRTTVSRRFKRASEKKLKKLLARKLDKEDFVAIIMDGKTFQEDRMIIAMGVTIKGKKVFLGIIQAGTENAAVCKDFLDDMITRGLKIKEGILCVIDGSKGLRKGIEKAFGEYAFVQRCQWHKRENVVKYLPDEKKAAFKRELQEAYEKPTYKEAKKAIGKIKSKLAIINESAVRSLEEGLEETLTLHKLGVFGQLGISLKTTNCIESVMSQVEQMTGKVDSWKNSNQKQRWVATALLDIEPRIRKIKGCRHLHRLREAIQMKLELRIKKTHRKVG